jgi:YesN/AraC family two-component response regulator
VEDNHELLNFIDSIFSKEYKTTLCTNGQEGLIAALDLSPDIIISDLMMPIMDGLQFCKEIKSSIETCHIPFVILTAKSGDENKMEGYEYGAEAYVEKPFNPAILQQRVKNLLRMQQQLNKRMRDNLVLSFTEEPNICVHDKKLLESILNFVVEHIDKPLSITDITEAVGISRTLLHTKLKKLVGLSATEYITKIRLERSLKLINEGRNVSEVAYMVGFTSPNYFSRCFKKAFCISPREYSMRKES